MERPRASRASEPRERRGAEGPRERARKGGPAGTESHRILMDRRQALRALASAPVAAAAISWTEQDVWAASDAASQARQTAARAQTKYQPKFFTAHEWTTVAVLANLIIPKDAKSGSATDAGVPEFMDFMMIDQPARQNAMRGGLAWLDAECQRRADKTFLASSDAERRAVLDDIAWPRRQIKPGLAYGVTFFNSFRDLTASGFFTSKMGMTDLEYIGNMFVSEWKGCPPEWLKKLGV
jgi:gluconate 2-dehydrogenase gamma chain